MDLDEIRLRCLEAASKAPIVHNEGPEVGVLAVARRWAAWVEVGDSAVPPAADGVDGLL